jgi:hypothetical protein
MPDYPTSDSHFLSEAWNDGNESPRRYLLVFQNLGERNEIPDNLMSRTFLYLGLSLDHFLPGFVLYLVNIDNRSIRQAS